MHQMVIENYKLRNKKNLKVGSNVLYIINEVKFFIYRFRVLTTIFFFFFLKKASFDLAFDQIS